jgi:hypothetical protein
MMKAAGIDPQAIIKMVEDTLSGFKSAVENLQGRLETIDAKQAEILHHQMIINARLERIETQLAITAEVEDVQDTSRQHLIAG